MSKKLARSTAQSVKEGMTVLAILGSFLTDILTPLGNFSGGLAAIGLLLFVVSGAIWAMRRFPDTTPDGQIAHTKWAVLVSGGVAIICGGIYGAQLYLADVDSSQLGFLGNHLGVVKNVQRQVAPRAYAQAIEDIREGVHATQEAARRAEEAAQKAEQKAGEAEEQAEEAAVWARKAYKEIAYTNTPEKIHKLLQHDKVSVGIPAQLIRKYPFDSEISGKEAVELLHAFPDEYRRDLIDPLIQAIAPGISVDAFMDLMKPLSSGKHARDVASEITPKATKRFSWKATEGFWQECLDQFALEVCRWKAYAIHPAFEPLDGEMLIHMTETFIEKGGNGSVVGSLKARGATANELSSQYKTRLSNVMEKARARYPDRYFKKVATLF